ncbi:MAG: hypothetical protein Kow00122_11450 [Thermoleophilia bacterium]
MPQTPATAQAATNTLPASRESAEVLVAKLTALTQAAQVFGSGMAGVDVQIGWSLQGEKEEEEIRWTDPGSDHPRVHVQLNLNRAIGLVRPEETDPEAAPLDAFKAGFLHQLGHILYSGRGQGVSTDPERDPFAEVTLHGEAAALATVPAVREIVRRICSLLEDARIERALTAVLRGARRYLAGHPAQVLDVAHGVSPLKPLALPGGHPSRAAVTDYLDRLVAVLFLQIWGVDDQLDRDRVPAEILTQAERLRPSLRAAVAGEDPEALATWVGRYLLPEIHEQLVEIGSFSPETPGVPGSEQGAGAGSPEARGETNPGFPADSEGTPDAGSENGRRPGLSTSGRPEQGDEGEPVPAAAGTEPDRYRDHDLAAGPWREGGERGAVPELLLASGRAQRPGEGGGERSPGFIDYQAIVYPHVDGHLIFDKLPVAQASQVQPTERTSEVVRDIVGIYGPMALAAFSGEAAALRRAFQVNYERRLSGRYRSGKRVGVANMRRFMTSEDLRLFQRIEVPDRLSYYFHLLVDVSPSMLTNKNAQKAIATAYAFADALHRLRVPVDVTLYSSAVTRLFDHRSDSLDLFFGGSFGYLSSGTHEIEAIAYAKQHADAVAEERKIVVVITDGHPNSLALRRAGAGDLRSYYRSVLIPWLRRVGIDLMAIGIGTSPTYHENAVTISSGWDSIGVLMRLLDDVIARGESSHSALWR